MCLPMCIRTNSIDSIEHDNVEQARVPYRATHGILTPDARPSLADSFGAVLSEADWDSIVLVARTRQFHVYPWI